VKRLAVLAIALAIAMAMGGAAQPHPWADLRVLVGKWEGPAAPTWRGRRLPRVPKSAATKPEVHEDFGWFSYDRNLKKIGWRQFHDEGFVNEYTLDSASADGKALDFVSVRIENIAPEWRKCGARFSVPPWASAHGLTVMRRWRAEARHSTLKRAPRPVAPLDYRIGFVGHAARQAALLAAARP